MNVKGFLLIAGLDAVSLAGLVSGKPAALAAIQAVMRHEIPL
jgi:hypothetical protein